MQKRLGENFKFISTVKIFQWRLDLGFKDLDSEYSVGWHPNYKEQLKDRNNDE